MAKYRAIPHGFLTVGQVAKKMGVTVRTLQYYDRVGVLSPSAESEGGRRLYTEKDFIRLHQILSLKSLGFSLEEIERLTASLKAIEQLKTEVLQMQTVNFKKYADIIVNLQMKNDSYHLIKHFDDGMLDNIRIRFDKAGALNFMQRFNQLGDAIVQLKEAGVPPESEKGQRAAEEYWGLVMEFTNGDVSMLPELIKIGKMDAAENAWEQRQKLVNEYIEPALQAYFSTCEAGPFGKGGKGKE